MKARAGLAFVLKALVFALGVVTSAVGVLLNVVPIMTLGLAFAIGAAYLKRTRHLATLVVTGFVAGLITLAIVSTI